MPMKDGVWVPEDDSVASNLAKLQSQDSPIMRQAQSAGLKSANRRGVMNSSIGIGAGVAATLGALTPIASQDAQLAGQKNMQQVEDSRTRELTAAQIASADRGNQGQIAASLANNYNAAISNTLTNDKIPAGTRSAVQQDISNIYKSQTEALTKLYGGTLTWATPAPPASIAPAAPGSGVR